MTTRATPRLTGYACLAALGLLGGVGLRRPELVALAAPFALLLALGLQGREPSIRSSFSVAAERALEGDEVAAELVLRAEQDVERLEVRLALPNGVELVEPVLPLALRLRAGEERVLGLRLRGRWGSWALGDVRLRSRDRYGLQVFERRLERPHRLRLVARAETMRALLSPADTQAATGSEVARTRGEGIEFADTRPFTAGDRLRSVNWRASARQEALVVNERRPERNADLVIFLDSFSDAGGGDGILARAVRAAMAVAEPHLRRRDRVGLVSFGGTLRWLEPGSGNLQRYRLVDALLETQAFFSYAWKDVNVIPPKTLPPRSLVVAITPLLDPRSVNALLDLARRRFDLAVIEIPWDEGAPGNVEPVDELARRLWMLQRQNLRARLAELGVAVSSWSAARPLDVVLEEVRSFRRHARLARR